ncbi:amino acid ABC transporter permease [Burkholderia ubonensis]|uniref:Amino acid ABC transporter permease n=1 Tax=Burkholderia ubonensis TaxID=101571 RepID=A0AB74D5J1_9BURK|nr:amino acid ABC transporter permease [Burkholderia ubonensis]AOK63889.1 amino acid ABC transporter [Burkholderia ubonensis]PAJ77815.1 amino acid ABC transporter permease [Burkholderia ubonensis]PAJ84540.1 amino acid ABC transporter permease [Burkholderia ubonensis]PAJ91763.1 amino acid ABC transporter permease [Burkholderia ubonensis]PAJ98788.1 amino acid ABC transporter permease [Burkholderia ubonensis]
MAIDTLAPPTRTARRPAVATALAALVVLAVVALAVAGRRHPTLVALATWLPALGRAMLVNIGISALAIALGTLAGLVLGPLTLARLGIARIAARAYVQLFRNAPLLVLIYFSTYVFPFEVRLGHASLPFPDWFKVTVGLALPASANFAEIFRGAIQSIPHAQWDAARSLAFSRARVFRWIILPQCVRRMLPPWMNLYASITMATALASLVGVHDLLDTAQVASNTVARADFTVVVYFTVLGLFFAYCYPIARFTRLLERRHAFH